MKTTSHTFKKYHFYIIALTLVSVSLVADMIFLPINANEISLNASRASIVSALLSHPDQVRKELELDERLNEAAQLHAEDMAENKFFSHVNLDGENANYRVIEAGYPLPTSYKPENNNVESIAAGYKSIDESLNGLYNSPGHREHVLGLNEFFAEQTKIGIGWVNTLSYSNNFDEPEYKTYLVIITAP